MEVSGLFSSTTLHTVTDIQYANIYFMLCDGYGGESFLNPSVPRAADSDTKTVTNRSHVLCNKRLLRSETESFWTSIMDQQQRVILSFIASLVPVSGDFTLQTGKQ